MDVAILHFHLNRGGVTQVILNHLRSLDTALERAQEASWRIAILYGGRRESWPEDFSGQLNHLQVTLRPIPALDYDEVRPPCSDLAAEVRQTLRELSFRQDSSVLHVHNHALGKNALLPPAIGALAEDGWRSLLQIHDFAEDFRPGNYRRLAETLAPRNRQALPDRLYPQASQIHYAALNARDQRILQNAGVAESRLHLLPNPVADFDSLPERSAARRKLKERFHIREDVRFVLYPVRGIRRKNLGESLLWAALSEPDTHFGLTLPPINPQEKVSYEYWKRAARRWRLRYAFEVGGEGGLSFHENLVASDSLLTTSVAEGFGMVFLEAWLTGRNLDGRDLPAITADFKANQLNLQRLTTRVAAPLVWRDVATVQERLKRVYLETSAAYDQAAPSAAEVEAEFEQLVVDRTIDFACLDVELQTQVIDQVVSSSAQRKALRSLNPSIDGALRDGNRRDAKRLIAQNALAVRRGYSLASSGKRLRQLYQVVLESPCEALQSLPHGERILRSFLRLSQLHPIRLAT